MSNRVQPMLLILAGVVVLGGLITAGVQRGNLEATINTSGRIVPKNPTFARSGATG